MYFCNIERQLLDDNYFFINLNTELEIHVTFPFIIFARNLRHVKLNGTKNMIEKFKAISMMPMRTDRSWRLEHPIKGGRYFCLEDAKQKVKE